ncbi:ankyrin repeat-containing domain protein, partial [Coprinopsis sp. MPI-PUGE-AT-0042]
ILALSDGHDAVVAALLRHPDIDIKVRDHREMTPLMLACKKGMVESTKLILARDSFNINEQDAKGYTALMHATENGHQELVDHLLCIPDIDLDLKQQFGLTAGQLREGIPYMPPIPSESYPTGVEPQPAIPHNTRTRDSTTSLPNTESLYHSPSSRSGTGSSFSG